MKLMRRFFISIFCLWVLLYAPFAAAALNLELTRGVDSAIPIAIVPFAKPSASLPTDVSDVIMQDLKNSGQFNVADPSQMTVFPSNEKSVNLDDWKSFNINAILVGNISYKNTKQLSVHFALLSMDGEILIRDTYTVSPSELRHLAHQIANQVYEKMLGISGVFTTKIAYIEVKTDTDAHSPIPKREYQLMVADADGFNPHPILSSAEPIMSPAWSPNGKEIAYVSFEHQKANIYISNIYTGTRRLITSFAGINGAPAFSPDGKKLAIVLSTSGTPNIYLVTLATGKLMPLTHDFSINTEPAFSPDGQSIIFTSDRGGGPQIYEIDIGSGKTTRLTYSGNYNARASFTPDGKSIVFMHRDSDNYGIAIQDLDSGAMTVLTNSGDDASPSVAPNGEMVVYAFRTEGQSVLGMISTDGRVTVQLPERAGGVQEPAWSSMMK